MVVILAMGIGLLSPPFGLGYYAACSIGQEHPNAALKRIWSYLAALVVGLCHRRLGPLDLHGVPSMTASGGKYALRERRLAGTFATPARRRRLLG